ncbi:MAG: response regulator transcription factor [Acidobacteria bacterium]|nr:response regulator transcription factor [Acidobacteriota bacterium]
MSREISIIIADDHPIVRKGLREIIEADSRLKVLAEADDGEEAIRLIEELKPEIVVLDIDMPRLDGFGAARELLKRRNPVKIVFLTIHRKEDIFHAAMDLGVRGYILKESAIFEIVNGIKAVAEGEYFVTASLTSFLIGRRQRAQNFERTEPNLARLTPTERRILQLIADYKSNKEIAAELFVHYRTIETHRTNICQKLELQGHKALLKFAVENKFEL